MECDDIEPAASLSTQELWEVVDRAVLEGRSVAVSTVTGPRFLERLQTAFRVHNMSAVPVPATSPACGEAVLVLDRRDLTGGVRGSRVDQLVARTVHVMLGRANTCG